MLIGEDDISNAVITPGGCFHVFLNVCLHLCSFLLHADWRKFDSTVNVEPQGNWRQTSNSRVELQAPRGGGGGGGRGGVAQPLVP